MVIEVPISVRGGHRESSRGGTEGRKGEDVMDMREFGSGEEPDLDKPGAIGSDLFGIMESVEVLVSTALLSLKEGDIGSLPSITTGYTGKGVRVLTISKRNFPGAELRVLTAGRLLPLTFRAFDR